MYKRRRYIVNADFQGKFILTFVFICLSGMTAAVGLFNYLALNELEDIKWRMVYYENTLGDIVAPHLVYLGIFAVLFIGIAMSLVSWCLLWKVAGPIYRMKKDIDSAGEGDLSISVMVRRRDAFKDTARELDKMVSGLRERFGKIDADFRDVKKILDSLRDSRENLLMTKWEQLSHSIEKLNGTLKG